MKQKLLEIVHVTVLFETFPPLMICFFLVLQKRQRSQKTGFALTELLLCCILVTNNKMSEAVYCFS